jgi:hypothetical protein
VRALAQTLRVPQTCRIVPSIQRFGDPLVGAIQPPGVVLLDHPRRRVTQPEGDQDEVRSGLQGHRRARVPQLPEPEPLDARALEGGPPDPVVEVLAPEFLEVRLLMAVAVRRRSDLGRADEVLRDVERRARAIGDQDLEWRAKLDVSRSAGA